MPRLFAFTTTALALAAALSGTAQAATYTVNPGAMIPDGNSLGISSTIQVADSFSVGSVSVTMALSHTWIGDLIVRLSHGGTSVTLMDRPGTTSGNALGDSSNLSSLVPITFSGSATQSAESMGSGCGLSDLVGLSHGCNSTLYLPEQSLSVFAGSLSQGDWVLSVSDVEADDIGRLASWSLNLTAGQSFVPLPVGPAPLPPSVSAVPEPGSLALAAIGVLGLLYQRRRSA